MVVMSDSFVTPSLDCTEPPLAPGAAVHGRAPVVIDCGTCVMRLTSACRDCMVTALLDHRPDDALVFDLAEYRAVRLLADAGLVPSLRHREAEATG